MSSALFQFKAALNAKRAAAVLVLSFLAAGCMMFARPPKDLDYSRTRASEAGLYRATIKPQGDSIPQGKLQRWVLHIERPNGVPVDACQIAVDGGMPQHGHGLPTKPRMTRALGNGDYVIDEERVTGYSPGGPDVVRAVLIYRFAGEQIAEILILS